jgi:hypothetical protein
MKSRVMKLALAVTAFLLMSGASFAQSPWWRLQQDRDRDRDNRWGYQDRDRDRDGVDDRYEHGLRDGRSDRQNRRGWHPRNSGAAYMSGYRAGFGRDWRQGDDERWRNNRGPGNSPYGNAPNGGYQNAQRVAYNNGFQEGQRYGEADRSRGKRYEPTGSGVYQDADRGYSSSYGDKSAYRSSFRNGYLAGYQRGYGRR